jgi:membrane protease YdiL (CAAX protease family)
VQIGSYVLFPLAACRYLKLPVRELGLGWRGRLKHGRSYLPLLAAALPFVVLASLRSDFLARYPFYQPLPGDGVWPHLAIWWMLYALQFAALEFFFRGFLVHGFKHRLGFAAVFAMVIPYNMLHFQKPLLEALAAIVGGSVLGILSLRYRSIWWGVVLHVTVAGAMDVLSLARQGWF